MQARNKARPRFTPPNGLEGLVGGALVLAGLSFVFSGVAAADQPEATFVSRYADLSLEELINIRVTSVSKREEDLTGTAAAIHVLTGEDIRRSGVTNIPDALRMVPGMNVAAINSSQWAVSARGFNSHLSNKLLVLVDGRAVYNPLFAGVYWDLQQVVLEDVDRIEVIRGPGATLWGANAVNGVINVITRSARETQGTYLYGGGGNVHQVLAGARYGGQTDEQTYYRVFSTYQMKDEYPLRAGGSAKDGWHAWHGGFRFDRYPAAPVHTTWQADATVLDLDGGDSDAYNFNTIGRWTGEFENFSEAEAQIYYDRTQRDEAWNRTFNLVETLDLSFRHSLEIGERNQLVWGGGYRSIFSRLRETSPNVSVRNDRFSRHLFSTFAQNEFQVVPDRLSLTAGTKLEHNDFTGFELQPSVRAAYKPAENQTVWASVSRAVRTPTEIEARDTVLFPIAPTLPGPGGDPAVPFLESQRGVTSEILWAYELGYRIHPTRRLSLDFATFYHVYDDIIWVGDLARFEPGSPFDSLIFPWANAVSGETYGGEAFAVWAATEQWRLSAAYSLLFARLESDSAMNAVLIERSAPRHQVVLRSSLDVSERTSLDGQLRFVDTIQDVPSYFTADLALFYRTANNLELSLVGQNLLERRHPEHRDDFLARAAEIPRGFYGKLSWRF